jgi:hypothetical protein
MSPMLLISLLLLASSAEGGAYLSNAADVQRHESSNPCDQDRPFIASFMAQNNTLQESPVSLGAPIFLLNLSPVKSLNLSDYYRLMGPFWDRYTFYTSSQGWPLSIYEDRIYATKFMNANWKPDPAEDSNTPTIKQFLQDDYDQFQQRNELHNDRDYEDLQHFLEGDEPLERPLL